MVPLNWDLNRLKVAYVVSQHRSVGAAAKRLGVTPSAVSQQLKQLETGLGYPLFIRSRFEFVPTDAGKALLKTVEPFLNELEQTVQFLAEGKRQPYGKIAFGAPCVLGADHVSKACLLFQEQFPRVKIEMVTGLSFNQISEMEAGKLNFAVIDAGRLLARLFPIVVAPFIHERQVLACSKSYFDRAKVDNSVSNLVQQRFVSYTRDALEIPQWFRYHYGRTVSDLEVAFHSNDTRAVLEGVRHGGGIGLLPRYLIEDDIRRGDVVVIKTEKDDYLNPIMIAHLASHKPNLAERTFLKFMREHFRKTYPSGII